MQTTKAFHRSERSVFSSVSWWRTGKCLRDQMVVRWSGSIVNILKKGFCCLSMLCGECEERRREFFYTRAAEEDYWNICRKISREKLIMLSPVNKPLLLKLCSFTSHVPTPHCTMDPAMDIDISKVYKSKDLFLAHLWLTIFWRMVQNYQQFYYIFYQFWKTLRGEIWQAGSLCCMLKQENNVFFSQCSPSWWNFN